MFERFSQRKRSDFEQVEENFNIIEASEQMEQPPPRRRGRSSGRERRGRREGNRDGARGGARDGARGGARGGVEGGVEGDAADGTNVLMKDVF